MSKFSKNAEKNNRKVTDFFQRRSSTTSSLLSQPSSSQPSSSQPRPSQRITGPSASQPRMKATKTNNAPPGPEKEVISLSSDSGPIVISSDDTSKSHISISSNTTSPIVVSDSSPHEKPKLAVATSQPVKTTKSAKQVSRPAMTQPSTAKTTVKKRLTASTAPGSTSHLSLPKVSAPRKRKCNWDESSSSEESNGRLFIPRPGTMKPSLAHAPVPQGLAHPPPSKDTLAPSSPLTSLYSVRSKSSRSSKRARLDVSEPTTAVSGNDADDEELIPSSQSDEQELIIPKNLSKDPAVVKDSVNKWRRESSVAVSPMQANDTSFPLDEPPATPPATSPAEPNWPSDAPSPLTTMPSNMDGDIQMEDSASLGDLPRTSAAHTDVTLMYSTSADEKEVSQQLHLLNPSSSSSSHNLQSAAAPITPPLKSSPSFGSTNVNKFRLLTPPPSAPPPETRATPIALNAEQKTTMMIERLKAEAAARVAEARGSSDEEPASFDDFLSDSSDDELKFDLSAAIKRKRKAKTSVSPANASSSSKKPSPSSSPEKKPHAAPRYSLRRRSSPVFAFARVNSPGPSQSKPSLKKTANPLDKLLREKKTKERKGEGIDSLLAAEAALADSALAKGKMKAEMDAEEYEDDEDDVDWGDETAAMRVVVQRAKGIGLRSGGPGSDDDYSENEAEEFAVDDATKLLGADVDKATAVNKILAKDRKSWLGKKKAKKTVKGVPLWEGVPTPLAQDESFNPALPYDETTSGALQFLKTLVASADEGKLGRCLVPQLFSTLDRSDLLSLVPWVTSIVLSSSNELLTQRATAIITYIARKCAGTPLEISPLVASCLRELGAKEERLSGLAANMANVRVRCSPLLRGYAVSRLVDVTRAFVENDAVATEDIPDLINMLLLVGLDPSASLGVRTELTVLIDTLGSRIPTSSEGVSDMEPALCAKLLELIQGWNAKNQAFAISFFRGRSPQLVRISRWLAYATLTDLEIPGNPRYFALPDLEPILILLSPHNGDQTAFDVMGNADKDDFCEKLRYSVEFLEVVLHDIDSFVQDERRNAAFARQGDASRPASPEKAKAELELAVDLLERVHGKINDSRAGDLDRSRVKASMQHCWSRVSYERTAAMKASSSGKPRNLRGYFPRPVQSSGSRPIAIGAL